MNSGAFGARGIVRLMSEPEQPEATSADEAAAPSAAPPQDLAPGPSPDPASGSGPGPGEGPGPAEPNAENGASSEEDSGEDVFDEFGAPFVPKTFGGAFVWAKGEGFVTTVLRIKAGKSVPVATTNRQDMHVMLTGGRAVLEVDDGTEVDRIELVPAGPLLIDPAHRYRLIAMTEVEIFTVYTQL